MDTKFITVKEDLAVRVQIYREGINENNGSKKRYFGYDRCTDSFQTYINIKVPFFFVMITISR